MIKLFRWMGYLLIAGGCITLVTVVLPSLHKMYLFIRGFSIPVQIGLVAAVLGLLILMASLIWERIQERPIDRSLRDDPEIKSNQ